MEKVVYRAARREDIPDILELWRQFWPPQPYESNLEPKIQRDPDLVCVAESDGRVIGTIIGGFDNWWAWIYRVAVGGEYQNKGIGMRLFKEMHERLKLRGADAVCVIASPSNKTMYHLLGKVEYEEKKDKRLSHIL